MGPVIEIFEMKMQLLFESLKSYFETGMET